MAAHRVTPDRALELLDSGWLYLDVRSREEFEQDHPAGAYNVPLQHAAPGGRVENPEFFSVVERAFPRDTRLVIGCRTGRRSLEAAERLLSAGYNQVVDMRGGLEGEGAGGTAACQGWRERGYPVSTAPETGRSYDELRRVLLNGKA